MIKNVQIDSNGIKLNVLNFGGNSSQDILLLHGLAGRGNEWENTAEWLIEYGRVHALDQRGHGKSLLDADDFTRNDYVQDAIQVIEQHCRPPIILIGQSMGGLNAFLVAAKRPDLVKTLIVVEATPEPDVKAQQNIRNWLESWPVPFQNLNEAKEFFGGDTLYSQTFVDSLRKYEDGYRPVFHTENMIRSLEDIVSTDYWNEWKKITCPTLIVGGEKSSISQDILKEMAGTISKGQYICIPKAGHDLHLDEPYEWRRTVEKFFKKVL